MGKAITEADGLFAIVVVDNAAAGSRSAIIRLMLLARHTSRNLVAAVEIDAKATGPIEVKLQPGITLSGKVAGPQDKPIAKATVRVMLESWGRFTSLTSGRGLTTDAAGRYEVRALPPGQRLLIYASAADFGRTYVEVNLAEAPDGRVEARPIVLKVANLSLAGTVFNNYTGKPVVGALVRVSGQGQPYGPGIKTDADGKFRFDQLCEGKVELSSSAADFHSAGVEIELDAAADRHVAAPPILLTPLPKITGVVRDPEGQPVPGASIVLLAEGEPPVKFKSDAQGTFTTTLDPDYVARRDDVGLMLLARHTSRNLVVAIEIGAKATGPLEVELQPGVTLSGKVAGPQDKPIAEATVGVVAVMRRDSKETGRVWRLPPGRRITTDAAGRYEVKVLPPGQRLWITASAADFGRTDVVAHLAGAADGRVEAPPMVLKWPICPLPAPLSTQTRASPSSVRWSASLGEDSPLGQASKRTRTVNSDSTSFAQGRFSSAPAPQTFAQRTTHPASKSI